MGWDIGILFVDTSLSVFFDKATITQKTRTELPARYAILRFSIDLSIDHLSPNPQIVQHRSTEYVYGRTTTTPFSSPLLASYLPLSTTIGEFRSMLAVVLKRFVLPCDAARKVCMVVQLTSASWAALIAHHERVVQTTTHVTLRPLQDFLLVLPP